MCFKPFLKYAIFQRFALSCQFIYIITDLTVIAHLCDQIFQVLRGSKLPIDLFVIIYIITIVDLGRRVDGIKTDRKYSKALSEVS